MLLITPVSASILLPFQPGLLAVSFDFQLVGANLLEHGHSFLFQFAEMEGDHLPEPVAGAHRRLLVQYGAVRRWPSDKPGATVQCAGSLQGWRTIGGSVMCSYLR